MLLWRLDRDTVAATAAAAAVAADRRAVVVPPVLPPGPAIPDVVFDPLAKDIEDDGFDDDGGEGAVDEAPGPGTAARFG